MLYITVPVQTVSTCTAPSLKPTVSSILRTTTTTGTETTVTLEPVQGNRDPRVVEVDFVLFKPHQGRKKLEGSETRRVYISKGQTSVVTTIPLETSDRLTRT